MKLRIPNHVAAITPYVPGKPVKEVERELGLKDTIKMASNENPLGPSPKAIEAIREILPELNIYPEGSGYYLCEALSGFYEVPPEQIILGNGSMEIIEIAAKTLLGPGVSVVISEGCFGMFRIACQTMNCEIKAAPMRDRTHDLEAMLSLVDEHTRLLIIASPNNPTGTYNAHADVARLLERVPEHVLVIVDEAYKEFVDREDYRSCLDLLPRFHNLMVLGTFSKAYGLAGLRIGYGFAQHEVVTTLHKIRSPFNTSVPSQVAGIAALGDQDFVQRYVAMNREERDFVCSELQKMGVVTTPSATNFVLMDAPIGGLAFFQKMLHEGVIVRPMGGWGFPGSVRVTFHVREGNERFLAATKKVLNL